MIRLYRRLLIVACTAALVGATFCAQASASIISQAPNQNNGYLSDPGFPQSMADSFVIGREGLPWELLTWYGIYFDTNSPTAVDNFTINIFSDDLGIPGNSTQFTVSGVDGNRVDTGLDTSFSDEYQYTFDLGGLNLAAGTYWIEIYNSAVNPSGDFWYWSTADLDLVNGIAGSAFASQAPGVNWINFSGADLAFSIDSFTSPTIPEPTSLMIFGSIAGIGLMVRRRNS